MSLGKHVLQEAKDYGVAHGVLYTKICKILSFEEELPPNYYNHFFKYCAERNWRNTEKKLDKQLRENIIKKHKKHQTCYCQGCGSEENLTIHHIKKKSEYPHLRYNEDNILLLCQECHNRLHYKEDHTMEADTVKKKILGISETQSPKLKIKHTLEFPITDYEDIVSGNKIQETYFDTILPVNVGDIVEAIFIEDDGSKKCNEFLVITALDTKEFSKLTNIDAVSEGCDNIGKYKEKLQKKYLKLYSEDKLEQIIFTHININ